MCGRSVKQITVDEVEALEQFLKELGEYMEWRGDTTMATALLNEMEHVQSVRIDLEMRDAIRKKHEMV